MIMNNVAERIWKEGGLVSFKVLSRHFLGLTEKNSEDFSQDSNLEAQEYEREALPTKTASSVERLKTSM
jgi:hypothetical protein